MPDLQAIEDRSRYRIVRKIADGGMGSVYEAVQEGTNGFLKTVAIKTILPKYCQHDRVVKMFITEAKLVADLVHENIVQIYQLGRTPDLYYIVMEYVNGLSLYDFIRFHNAIDTPVPRDLAVFFCSRIARGLAYAHERINRYGQPLNIVHRDVCPNNIMVTTEGLPKLTDFGIAQVASAMEEAAESGLMGKVVYMSPEQARREKTDFRSDQYSLGVVLFELLAGVPIRYGESEQEVFEQARLGNVEWDFLPEDLDEMLRGILRRCLEKQPDDRYASTRELATAMEYFIYKDGYGPTIQTLEAYLKKQFSYLYQFRTIRPNGVSVTETTEVGRPYDLAASGTLIMADMN